MASRNAKESAGPPAYPTLWGALIVSRQRRPTVRLLALGISVMTLAVAGAIVGLVATTVFAPHGFSREPDARGRAGIAVRSGWVRAVRRASPTMA